MPVFYLETVKAADALDSEVLDVGSELGMLSHTQIWLGLTWSWLIAQQIVYLLIVDFKVRNLYAGIQLAPDDSLKKGEAKTGNYSSLTAHFATIGHLCSHHTKEKKIYGLHFSFIKNAVILPVGFSRTRLAV
jgi:hypothetical protein